MNLSTCYNQRAKLFSSARWMGSREFADVMDEYTIPVPLLAANVGKPITR